MEIIYLVIGVVFGVVIGYLVAKQLEKKNPSDFDESGYKAKLDATSTILEDLKSRNKETEGQLEVRLNEIQSLSRENAQLEQQLNHLKEKLESQKSDLEKLNEKFSAEFKNLANQILDEKSKKFTETNKENIDNILNPLKQSIKDFEEKVEKNYKEEFRERTTLKTEIENLVKLNKQLHDDATNLTTALKGDSKAQGNWGEFILESILEKSGLIKGREYFVQESMTTEIGKRMQPDVVVKLPDNKNIVVDSKVSLTAYERYVSSDDDSLRQENLKLHIQSIRKHIKDLSEKNYQNLHGVEGLDFVLMFIAIEPAFSLAVQHDNELFSDAYAKNIVIVSPSTLIATLRTIANIWKNEYQNRNAMEIAERGGRLYDKFKNFTDDLEKLGKHMDDSKKFYEAAMNKLSTGPGNLIGQTEKLKKLGAKSTKQIDQKWIQKSLDSNGEEE